MWFGLVPRRYDDATEGDRGRLPEDSAPMVLVAAELRTARHGSARRWREAGRQSRMPWRCQVAGVGRETARPTELGQCIRGLAGADHRLRSIEIDELPTGWTGKSYACWRGALVASKDAPEWLCFIDADTVLLRR